MDELQRRRSELEWALETSMDTYIASMLRPTTWGGEMELLLSSHVLRRPVAVAMRQSDGTLRFIATYGEEYGQERRKPPGESVASDSKLNVLFHGAGHYEGLVDANRYPRHRSRL
jgi:OTU domain-containing protein 6